MLRLGWDIDERAKAKNMHGDLDPVFGQKPLNEPLMQEFDICVLTVPSDVIFVDAAPVTHWKGIVAEIRYGGLNANPRQVSDMAWRRCRTG
jgi:hypothetical protein